MLFVDPMKHLVLLIITAIVFTACEQKIETPAPAQPVDKTIEKNTTIVQPPAEKKEEQTTIINPAPKTGDKTTTTTTTSDQR